MNADKVCTVLEHIGHVRTQAGVIPLVLFPWQRDLVKTALDNDHVAVLKSRDIGSSTIITILDTFLSMTVGGDTAIASYKKDSAKGLYEVSGVFLDYLPEPWNLLARRTKDTDYHMVLQNGAHITAMEMSPKVGRSFRAQRMVLSEVAFWNRPRESWAAITGSGIAGTSIVAESTPNELVEGALFEELYKNPDWKAMCVDYHGNPAHTPAWKVKKLAELNGDTFRFAQEYECSLDKSSGARTVLPMGEIHAAMDRVVDETNAAPVMGVDVARFGNDQSAIAKGTTVRCHEIITLRNQNAPMLAARVIDEAHRMADTYGALPRVKVDVIGVGAGVYDLVAAAGIPAVGVNVGTNPQHKFDGSRPYSKIYNNLKAQLWFEFRNLLGVVQLPHDEDLARQMVCGYGYDREGRYVVESKDDVRAALGRSPDSADAVILMFADMAPTFLAA